MIPRFNKECILPLSFAICLVVLFNIKTTVSDLENLENNI